MPTNNLTQLISDLEGCSEVIEQKTASFRGGLCGRTVREAIAALKELQTLLDSPTADPTPTVQETLDPTPTSIQEAVAVVDAEQPAEELNFQESEAAVEDSQETPTRVSRKRKTMRDPR